jgi:hypothetical protein
MGDPLYHDEAQRTLLADPTLAPVLMRVHRLNIASGLVALAITPRSESYGAGMDSAD